MTSETTLPRVLENLEQQLKLQDTEFQSLTRKSEQTITISTIIIVFATAFNGFNLNQTKLNSFEIICILLAFMVYAVVFWFALMAGKPKEWCGSPLAPTEHNISEAVKMNDDEFTRYMIGVSIGCLAINQNVIDNMAPPLGRAYKLILLEMFFVVLTKIV